MKRNVVVLGCLGVVVLAVLFVGGLVALSYNGMVGRAQGVDQAWAQVQNVYQRRADLIPNLVATVSGAANFEKSTLTEITAARASVGQIKLDPNQAPADPARLAQFQQAQDHLSSALSRLLVVVERYPELKATANFRDLQAQLEGTENRITVERQKFNEAVQGYNTTVKTFPNVMLAGLFGFQAKPYFTAKEGADTPPAVRFDFDAKPAPAKP
ncbi:MAG: LemA family protein [Verrucomicrobiota bacterium]|jgi:LemA protein